MGSRSIGFLPGEVYGLLTIIAEAPKYKSPYGEQSYRMLLCRCSCGNVTIVSRPNLKNGNTKSCGHLASERAKTLYKERKYYKKLTL